MLILCLFIFVIRWVMLLRISKLIYQHTKCSGHNTKWMWFSIWSGYLCAWHITNCNLTTEYKLFTKSEWRKI